MSPEQFKSKVNEICARVAGISPDKRLAYIQKELAAMPQPYRDAAETLVLNVKESIYSAVKVELFKARRPILVLVTIVAFLMGLVLVAGGIYLTVLGATGATRFNFVGQVFESTNVGIAAFFLGAVLCYLTLRRVLKS